ncbi:MAG: Clp1/GlmU family protein [Candidatus Bipolaricaulia bacterium]
MNDHPSFPFDLDRVLGEIEDSTRIMVLGGMDTGKTTLIRKLHGKLGGLVIDGDLGQSEIGPPGLISLGTYETGMKDGYFVGSFTPRGNLVQVMTGIARLVNRDPKRCFVDTDGWIDGEAARVYKGELISLVDPDVLLLLQREDELEKFSTYLSGDKVVNLKAQKLEEKSRGERSANRVRKFKFYFSRSRRIKKGWKELKIAGTLLGRGGKIPSPQLEKALRGEVTAGWKCENTLTVISSSQPDSRSELKEKFSVKRIEHHPTTDLKYRLVGCYQDGKFAGEGTITGLSSDGIEILTPEQEFNQVRPGKKRVKPSGRTIK